VTLPGFDRETRVGNTRRVPRRVLSNALFAPVAALAVLTSCSVLYSVSDFSGGPSVAPDGATIADSAVVEAGDGAAAPGDVNEAGAADAGDAADAQAYDGPAYAEEVLADTPLVYLRFDEAPDATAPVNGGSLTLAGAAYAPAGISFGAPGALAGDPNSAIALDGQSGNVIVGLNTELDFDNFAGYSLEIWMKADPTFFAQPSAPFERLFGKSAGNGNTRDGYSAFIWKGRGFSVERYVDNNVGHGSFGYIASDNADLENGAPLWFQVVVTFDGSQFLEQLYVDGISVGLNASNVALQGLAAVPFVVGGEGDGGAGVVPTWFKGTLDEFSAYDHALSGERIAKHYQAGVRRAR
jgi:Concanavalin A-like lectin/glucanases superfamily